MPEGGDGYQSPGQLNADHSEMLCCLKKRMRKIVCGDSTVNIESVEALSAKWIELTGTERAARGEMAVVTPIIEGIIGKVFGKWKQKEVTNDSTHESDTNRGPEPCNIQSIHNSSVKQTLRTLEIREKLRKKYELLDANAIELIFSSDKSESENGSLDSCKSSIIATATASTTIDQSQSVSVSVSKVKSRSDDYRGGCSLESVMIAMEREREMGDNTILNRIMNSAGSGSNTLQTSEYVKEEEKLGISMDFNLNLVSPMKVKSVSCDLSNNNNNENNDNSNNNNNDADPLPQSVVDPFEVTYNWEEIIYAVCWYRVNRTELEVAEQWTLAQRFLNLHGDSAPFIAAAYCASCADSQSSFECPGEEEKKMALAFMGHFPEDMEGWYEYNAGLEEPMLGLERSDKACRCIPRHFKKCPIPFDPSKMSEGDTKRARRDV